MEERQVWVCGCVEREKQGQWCYLYFFRAVSNEAPFPSWYSHHLIFMSQSPYYGYLWASSTDKHQSLLQD